MTIDWEHDSLATCVEYLRTTQSHDDALLLQGWAQIRARFQTNAEAYTEPCRVLLQQQRFAEAETLIQTARQLLPDDAGVLESHAWIAHGRGDLQEADRRWEDLRNRHPGEFAGYYGGGAILCALRRFDDADAVYRRALHLFPISAHLLADFAAVAQSRGNLEEARQRWRAARVFFPDDAGLTTAEVRSLRASRQFAAADEVLQKALQDEPKNVALLVELAQLAESQSHWEQALRAWDRVVTQDHGSEQGYLGAAQALRQLGRLQDAETILQPALRMYPGSKSVQSFYANLAHERQQWADGATRWEAFRKTFSGLAEGYVQGAHCLLQLSRFDQADALAKEGCARFPGDTALALLALRVAEHRQPWDAVDADWQQALDRFPTDVTVSAYAQALFRQGRLDDAEQHLAQSLRLHPASTELRRRYAHAAERRKDWLGLEARWRRLAAMNPAEAWSWAGLGQALRLGGKLDESEQGLQDALSRFAGDRDLERQLALTATRQRNWSVALPRWERVKSRSPADRGIADEIQDALWHARQDQAALSEADGGFEIPASLLASGADLSEDAAQTRRLLMGFESLGDSCEFGMVQRRFGADPISLLRWTSTPPDKLILALDTDFAGVGDAEYTRISADPAEYTTQDVRYHMFSHTFTPPTSQSIERFTVQHLKRMQYLRGKLLEDLKLGEKIFVYKCQQGLPDEQMLALQRAVCRHGASTVLLCVRLQCEGKPSGSLEWINTGLAVGYIDRFSTVDINVDAWVMLCQSMRPAQAAEAA